MTEQSSGASPEISVGEPRPLNFQLIADDGLTAVYEALVVDCETPGSPVFGLTVTVASSIRRDSGKEVDDLLASMKAAFVLLTEPPPDNGGPGDEQPFDSNTQVGIGFRLASFDGPEPAGLAFTVETTTGIVQFPEPGGEAIVAPLPHHLGAGLSDYWHSNSSSSFTAYVTPSIGDGTLSSLGKPSKALHAHQTSSTSGKVVVVTASQNRGMTYSLTGSGHLPGTDVR